MRALQTASQTVTQVSSRRSDYKKVHTASDVVGAFMLPLAVSCRVKRAGFGLLPVNCDRKRGMTGMNASLILAYHTQLFEKLPVLGQSSDAWRNFPECQSIRKTLLNTVHSRCLLRDLDIVFTLTAIVSW